MLNNNNNSHPIPHAYNISSAFQYWCHSFSIAAVRATMRKQVTACNRARDIVTWHIHNPTLLLYRLLPLPQLIQQWIWLTIPLLPIPLLIIPLLWQTLFQQFPIKKKKKKKYHGRNPSRNHIDFSVTLKIYKNYFWQTSCYVFEIIKKAVVKIYPNYL